MERRKGLKAPRESAEIAKREDMIFEFSGIGEAHERAHEPLEPTVVQIVDDVQNAPAHGHRRPIARPASRLEAGRGIPDVQTVNPDADSPAGIPRRGTAYRGTRVGEND